MELLHHHGWLVALLASVVLLTAPPAATAQSSPVVAPLLKLLEGGKVPPAGQATLVEMVCTKGDAGDLAVVFARLQQPEGFEPKLRLKVIELLTDAAVTRKLKPPGDLSGLTKLIASDAAAGEPALQLAAIRLAAQWKLGSIADTLQSLATAEGVRPDLQQAAIDGLVSIGDEKCLATIRQLATLGKSANVRILAVAGLAKLDLDSAAKAAAAVLAAGTSDDDPAAMLEAILNRKDGADKLAAALAATKLQPDVAKLCLRYMYSVGHSDQALSNVLSKAAGIAADSPPPTPDEVAKIAVEVAAQGDPVQGEKIFRRGDLSCLKCHSIAQAGGTVGPELTAIGSISPVDYVVNSILNPNLAIKEQYVTRKVLTVNGEVLTGIQIDRDEQRLRLRDATGKIIVVPAADIEQEGEGRSLMPQGLTKFLTHDEFLDLARFISELGKPGPYAIRKTPSIQRWRVLKSPDKELTGEIPNVEILREHVLDTPPAAWNIAYGKADGFLPLAELAPQRPAVLYLQGEIDVNQAGPIAVQLTGVAKTHLWIDAEPFDNPARIERAFSTGKHTLTLRIEVPSAPESQLKVEFVKPAGSAAQFVAVGGM